MWPRRWAHSAPAGAPRPHDDGAGVCSAAWSSDAQRHPQASHRAGCSLPLPFATPPSLGTAAISWTSPLLLSFFFGSCLNVTHKLSHTHIPQSRSVLLHCSSTTDGCKPACSLSQCSGPQETSGNPPDGDSRLPMMPKPGTHGDIIWVHVSRPSPHPAPPGPRLVRAGLGCLLLLFPNLPCSSLAAFDPALAVLLQQLLPHPQERSHLLLN